jgi:putative heme-binding domain-containing protein
VLEEVVALSGDAGRGRQVFAALDCAKCHDVSPTESLRGPYLPNVAKTYRRDQLTEAILMPSKSIAQGFAQNVFITDDGRALAGFVTKEGAEEIVIRDAEGVETRIPVESIEQRFERELSIMPGGLVDKIPVAALSDLVSYLESLK